LMNMGFAQGQASSAKEVEVYRKALEMISQHEDCLCKPGMEVVKEALLTSKPEPVALADAKKPEYPNFWVEETGKDEWKVKCSFLRERSWGVFHSLEHAEEVMSDLISAFHIGFDYSHLVHTANVAPVAH
jgi:hypothetical protein